MAENNADPRLTAESPTVDVLVVTATEVEGRTVIDLFQQETAVKFKRYFIGNKTYHDLGIVGNARVSMVQTEMGSGGPSGSLLTVQEAINALSPATVIMVGIAFGVDPKKQHIGDILVSVQLRPYELQRIGANLAGAPEVIARGDRPSASTRLVDRFRSGNLDWKGPKIRFGLMLSGDKLIDNVDFRNQLLKLEPEAIGGEMEGAGLYSAAERSKKDWIIVKAICDWADGTKNKNKKQRQQTAAQNAAAFIIHVLRQGGFTQRREPQTASKSLVNYSPQEMVSKTEEQARISKPNAKLQQLTKTTIDSPMLMGLVIDLSRSMINSLKNTENLQTQNLQDVLPLLIEKATALCKTPEAPEILPKFALFAFGYGFGDLRKGVNDIVGRLLNSKEQEKSSNIIPVGQVRDLFEEVSVKYHLPLTPDILILNRFWDYYKVSLQSLFVDVGLGRSKFYESLCRVYDRLHKELETASYTDPFVVFISDGQIDDASYRDAEQVTKQIQGLGVQIMHCYIGPRDIMEPKTFYETPGKFWPEQVVQLFNLSSTMNTTNPFLNNAANEARSRGWFIPEGARLFVQINHNEMLKELIEILLSAQKD
jgi:nucleoside phosphorylase